MLKDASFRIVGQKPTTCIVGEEISLPTYFADEREIKPVVVTPNGNKATVFYGKYKPNTYGKHQITAEYKDKVNGLYYRDSYYVDVFQRAIVYSSKPNKKKYSWKVILSKVVIYAILILFALITIVPFLFAFVTSFTEPNNIVDFKWIPSPIDIGNYTKLFSENNVLQAFANTFLYIIPPVFVGAFCSALCAYATARIRFRGHKIVFYLIVLTMFIPGIIILMPSYSLFVNFYHWFGTALPIIIPGLFGSAGVMFFLHQYFSSLPRELEEAAQIDGMSRFGIFTKIIMPLSVPALLTQIILSFNGAYNDYMTPLLYVGSNKDLWTVQILVNNLSTAHSTQYTLLMAGAMTALIPTLILYIFCQKFFVDGIAMSGIKG